MVVAPSAVWVKSGRTSLLRVMLLPNRVKPGEAGSRVGVSMLARKTLPASEVVLESGTCSWTPQCSEFLPPDEFLRAAANTMSLGEDMPELMGPGRRFFPIKIPDPRRSSELWSLGLSMTEDRDELSPRFKLRPGRVLLPLRPLRPITSLVLPTPDRTENILSFDCSCCFGGSDVASSFEGNLGGVGEFSSRASRMLDFRLPHGCASPPDTWVQDSGFRVCGLRTRLITPR